MINVLKLSTKYEVRKMRDSDAESILDLCSGNALFYQYCEAKPRTAEGQGPRRVTPLTSTNSEAAVYLLPPFVMGVNVIKSIYNALGVRMFL